MKKIMMFCLCCWCFVTIQAQHPQCHLADWLALDTSLTIQVGDYELVQKNWIAKVCDGRLWFCPRKPFCAQGKEVSAVIHSIDLHDYHQDSLVLCYPPLSSSWKKEALACCVYGLSIEGERLLLVCDNQLLLFARQKGSCKFVQRWFCFGVCDGYLHQGKVYALMDDKENSRFRWMVYASEYAQTPEMIRDLPQPVPFLLQFEPNRYLFVKEDALYYMPPGENKVKKFSLQGALLDSVMFNVENEQPFPKEMIRQAKALPYGVERINFALRNRYRQYSYAKTVDVLSDSLMLLSVNLGEESYNRQLSVMRLWKTDVGWMRDFCTLYMSDTSRIYADGFYPAIFHPSSENLLLYPHQGRLLQLMLAPKEENFGDMSVIGYKRVKDDYFKNHLPSLKLRVQSMRQPWRFYDYDNRQCFLEDLGKDRVVLVVSRQPQCSACQQYLLKFLSTVDTSEVALACLMGCVDSYLQRRQQFQQLAETGVEQYHLLYEKAGEKYGFLLAQRSYPSVFFWQKGWGIVGCFDTSDIFTDNLDKYEFSDFFKNAVKAFVEQR